MAFACYSYHLAGFIYLDFCFAGCWLLVVGASCSSPHLLLRLTTHCYGSCIHERARAADNRRACLAGLLLVLPIFFSCPCCLYIIWSLSGLGWLGLVWVGMGQARPGQTRVEQDSTVQHSVAFRLQKLGM